MKPDHKNSITVKGLAVLGAILLAACSATPTPAPTADVNAIYTQAAATVVLGLTQTSQAMPSATPTPTSTPEPSRTPTQGTGLPILTATPLPISQPGAVAPTPVPVDPAAAHGCYNASFVADVTFPYAPAFKPGDHFTKTWRVKNTGTCDWPRGFLIAFVSGDHFGADTTIINQKVTAGSLAEISLNMTAPTLGGVVSSNWQLATDIGKFFGPVLTASITLPTIANSTATSGGCLNSALVADLTIPTGTELQTNEIFTKTWRIKNTGTCAWNRDFKLTFVGGDLFGSDTTKIRQIVGPGGTMDISLDMAAPSSTGTISSAWQLASDGGQLFGQLFAFSIVVK
ncbi:MAG TPA: NBR1-Ig-like domain-containing protein [Anaerolineales bacterium]